MLFLVALFILLYKIIVTDGVHEQENDATKGGTKKKNSSPLEEFLSYMCFKLLTCLRFQFCSSSVVCTTLTWEQLALCCLGTIAL